MFCENCGQQIPDGSTFCSNCGAPAGKPAQEMPVEQQPVEQPVEQQPVEQPVQEQAPFDPQDQFNASAQQYEPAPAAPKQPVSPKTKKIIMFSAIGAGALAVILVALFVFIIPAISNANKLSLADYCTVQFDGIDYDKSSESSSEADKAEKKQIFPKIKQAASSAISRTASTPTTSSTARNTTATDLRILARTTPLR